MTVPEKKHLIIEKIKDVDRMLLYATSREEQDNLKLFIKDFKRTLIFLRSLEISPRNFN